mmetsp:Transcript_44353/g.65031  ORF Transcript_44353/g.65031 Transcript_44353/m.65031 type:complete len:312 (-) Transcript_44353:364-1299(-)|eukprot:CAMPEP_0179446370 /NCGR_PEP_ID=MMETSP0799-20121207/29752_1 /TAXON_ID=46947 /ORGANISM="Geminigera cryophila, Strain CCMP2564" /LENGTH=311 /DNA_ID=CAMNT_0021235217 /DNA_START=221 /DNA_END=1156 /DNA_ORIENTATION=+
MLSRSQTARMPPLAAAVALALAMIATLPGCAAFMTPSHSMHLLGRTQPGSFCKTPSVISSMRRVKREPAVTALKMELLGKRFWLWNASEWAFDKFVALTQVVVFTLYGVIARLFESPYDEARLKAIRRRIAELRASREAQEPRNALDMMDVVWEVGAADEKDKRAMDLSESPSASRKSASGSTTLNSRGLSEDGNIEAPELNSRVAFGFALVSLPILAQLVSALSEDVYLKASANASIWIVGLVVFVDWAAGSPSGVATTVKRMLPVQVRRAFNFLNPRSVYFTEEGDRGRRQGGEGVVPRPVTTDSNGLW